MTTIQQNKRNNIILLILIAIIFTLLTIGQLSHAQDLKLSQYQIITYDNKVDTISILHKHELLLKEDCKLYASDIFNSGTIKAIADNVRVFIEIPQQEQLTFKLK